MPRELFTLTATPDTAQKAGDWLLRGASTPVTSNTRIVVGSRLVMRVSGSVQVGLGNNANSAKLIAVFTADAAGKNVKARLTKSRANRRQIRIQWSRVRTFANGDRLFRLQIVQEKNNSEQRNYIDILAPR